MTAPTRNNVYIFGQLKDPKKQIPSLPQREIDAAAKRIKELTEKK